MKNIALDIDGVICNFSKGVLDLHPDKIFDKWQPDWFEDVWPNFKDNHDWWLSLDPIEIPNFQPLAYVTARTIDIEITKTWLLKHNFPIAPILHCHHKVNLLKEIGAEIFVEDKIEIFVNANLNGIKCFLFDQPYNRHHDTDLRIRSINALPNLSLQ